MMAQDTVPIRADERFDESRVAAHLRQHLPELVGNAAISFDQFPGGVSNLTYRAVAGDVELVLRRAPHGPVAKGGHDMEREYRVLSRLWQAYPQAPRTYHFCSEPEVMGKPFSVMERRRGWVIRDEWPEPYQQDEGKRRKLAGGFVDALAQLHLVDPARIGLDDVGHPAGFVERQIAGWSRRWEAAKTREVADMDIASARLLAGVPPPGPVTILHNDYKLENTMVSGGGDVVAVLDWEMATRGDALVDLGTLLAYWPEPDAPTLPIFGNRSVSLACCMTRAEVKGRYAALTGFDLSHVQYYEGLALFRIAVIIEQIYARYVTGQTADERFARYGPIAPVLAAAACDVLS